MLFNRRPCCGAGFDPGMQSGPFGGCGGGCGCGCDPIMEPCIEKCVKRDFCHEVKHICPVHTRIINNHIFRHVYDPQFTQSEENVVTNLDPGSCCNALMNTNY